MFGRTYYHDTLRKYVILFGTLFNDVWVNREDADGNVKQALKVPLSYGPKEKFLAAIEGVDANRDRIDQPFSVVLPRMGFEVVGFSYAPERKLPTRNRFTSGDTTNPDQRAYLFNPVPYDIQFSLSIFVKNTTDGTRIVEQILPYFTPEWTSTVQLIEDPDITLDIPLVLDGTDQDDVYEGSFEERRALIWNLNFTMKGFFFGPQYKSEVIKLANTSVFDATLYDDIALATQINNENAATRVINTLGQTATGQSTKYNELNVVQATAVASIDDGSITDITMINTGLGYSEATVTIVGGNDDATAIAVIDTNTDTIDRIEITNNGTGYFSTPTITISAPDLISVPVANISSESAYGEIDVIQNQPYV